MSTTVTALKSVVVTGGGTAGHVIPAKPVIERLLARGTQVTFIGSKSGLEERLVADLAVAFRAITTGKLRRYLSFQNVVDLFRVPIGILQAIRLLFRIQPDVVFSKGGYVAFPVVLAAWLLRKPVVSHESDLTAGLANRLAIPFTHTVCVNFAATKIRARQVVVTGTPIRDSLLNGNADRGKEFLKIDHHLPVLLVVGGSLGAEQVNAVVREALTDLCSGFQVVHVCGPGKLSAQHQHVDGYVQFEYIDEQWGDVLATADFVVSRAGANSLYELLVLRKPHLLIPLPKSASRGDQLENAEMAKDEGWSEVIFEEDLEPQNLCDTVWKMYQNRASWHQKLSEFERPDSVDLIEGVLASAAERA